MLMYCCCYWKIDETVAGPAVAVGEDDVDVVAADGTSLMLL